MAKKQPAFEDRVKEYMEKQSALRDSLHIREDLLLATPGNKKPKFMVRFATAVLRFYDIRIQSHFTDLYKK